jgi:hypothetical protein
MAELKIMATLLYGMKKGSGFSFISKNNNLAIRFDGDEVSPFLGGILDTDEIRELRDFLNKVLEEES